MDRLRVDELKPGHQIKLTTPIPNEPEREFGVVSRIDHVSDGPVCGIYRVYFEHSSFSLMANGDRTFEVPSSQPEARPHLLG